jgi:CRISPR-associated protein Cst1
MSGGEDASTGPSQPLLDDERLLEEGGIALLHWTGHALIDVGIAGLCAFSGRQRPEDLTAEDLDAAADSMIEHYYSGKLGAFLTCVFMNASFVQPSETPPKREAFINQYLRAHRAAPDPRVAGLRCAFSGRPATSSLVRTHFPLFSGEGVINFRPEGQPFVPAAGPFVVALFFLPFASRRAEGRLLAVHADDPATTLRFARRYLEDNRRLLALALPTERALVHEGYDRELPMWDPAKKRHKFADVKGPRSLVVYDLGEIARTADSGWGARRRDAAITAYLLSNSGQGPSLDIFQVPSGAVSFVVLASGAQTAAAWKAIAERFFPLKAAEEDDGAGGRARGRGKSAPRVAGRAGWTRNPAFEDLCAIFDAGFTDHAAAAYWLRRYVLGRLQTKEDYDAGAATARAASYERDTRARSWALAELFLEEIMGMKSTRVAAIRAFADKLAQRIRDKNDRKLRHALFYDELWRVRRELLRAQRTSFEEGGPPLFGLDEYTTVWLHEDGDERLVRDLICIRIVERLHELGVKPEEVLDAGAEGAGDVEEGDR